jgi:hypothetical protein
MSTFLIVIELTLDQADEAFKIQWRKKALPRFVVILAVVRAIAISWSV